MPDDLYDYTVDRSIVRSDGHKGKLDRGSLVLHLSESTGYSADDERIHTLRLSLTKGTTLQGTVTPVAGHKIYWSNIMNKRVVCDFSSGPGSNVFTVKCYDVNNRNGAPLLKLTCEFISPSRYYVKDFQELCDNSQRYGVWT